MDPKTFAESDEPETCAAALHVSTTDGGDAGAPELLLAAMVAAVRGAAEALTAEAAAKADSSELPAPP